MVFRIILFVWEFMMDIATVRGMGSDEKDLELLILRQQLRIAERKQARGPQIPRWQKVPLAVLAMRLKKQVEDGKTALEENMRLFKRATVIGWHRAMVRRKWTYKQGRKPGRPPIDKELEQLIVQVAKDNPDLGYEKLSGELTKLGYDVGKTTVSNVLNRHGIVPAPERGRQGEQLAKLPESLQGSISGVRFLYGRDVVVTDIIRAVLYRAWDKTSVFCWMYGTSDRGMGDTAGQADDMGIARRRRPYQLFDT